MSNNLTLIALGANLPSLTKKTDRIVQYTLQLINCKKKIYLSSLSRFYLTSAFPPGRGPDYINACAILRTDLPPEALLAELHGIEADLGRQRDGSRWGPRIIDIDLLAVGDLIAPDIYTHDQWRKLTLDQQLRLTPDQLLLPHPRLQDRAFVLIPLADIAPNWRHPRTGKTVTEMLAALPDEDRASVRIWIDNSPETAHVNLCP